MNLHVFVKRSKTRALSSHFAMHLHLKSGRRKIYLVAKKIQNWNSDFQEICLDPFCVTIKWIKLQRKWRNSFYSCLMKNTWHANKNHYHLINEDQAMNTETKPTMTSEQKFQSHTKPASPKTIDSHQLLGSGRECRITHAGQTYRLCHTRNDKLILIKWHWIAFP